MTVKVIQKTSVQSFKRNYLVKFCRDVLGGKQLSKIEEYTPKMNPKIPQNGSQQRERSCKKIFFFFFFIRKPYVKELNGSQEIEEHQKSEKHTKICKR